MVLKKLEIKEVAWGRLPKTIFCYVKELPNCKKCNETIQSETYAYLCDNDNGTFYCENCFTRDFLVQHSKDFSQKIFHTDKLVWVKLVSEK